MIGVVASLTVVSLASVPAVRLAPTDELAWRACDVGVAAGLAAGMLGLIAAGCSP